MKLTTIVDYIYVCAVTNAFPCNDLFFSKCIFFYLVKAKPIRYCIELPV